MSLLYISLLKIQSLLHAVETECDTSRATIETLLTPQIASKETARTQQCHREKISALSNELQNDMKYLHSQREKTLLARRTLLQKAESIKEMFELMDAKKKKIEEERRKLHDLQQTSLTNLTIQLTARRHRMLHLLTTIYPITKPGPLHTNGVKNGTEVSKYWMIRGLKLPSQHLQSTHTQTIIDIVLFVWLVRILIFYFSCIPCSNRLRRTIHFHCSRLHMPLSPLYLLVIRYHLTISNCI